jgi:DNA polymerase I
MVFLIDSSNLVYRCFFAIRSLTTSKGFPTNALHGVLKTLRQWIREYSPDHMAMVIDGETPAERLALVPGYKASRPPMPDDLEKQLPLLEELVPLFGIPNLEDPKQEADDLIASIAVRAAEDGQDVIIASNDKDFFQLLQPRIKILRQTAGQSSVMVDEAWLRKEWELAPSQVVDCLSLMGDSVDEIKGIDGVGEKTARKWLADFVSLEGIYENIGKLSPRFQAKMEGQLDRLKINRKVIGLRTDLIPHVHYKDLQRRTPDYEKLCKRLRELEFKNFPTELEAEAAKLQPKVQGELF